MISSTPKRFRIQSQRLAITLPQCDLPKEFVAKQYMERFNAKTVIVALEKHQDGNPHLHAYVGLSQAKLFSSPDFADIEGFHPNVQSVRCLKKWLDYVKKDGDYIILGDDVEYTTIQNKQSRKQILQKLVTKQITLPQIVEEDATWIINYRRLVMDLSLYSIHNQTAYVGPRDCVWITGRSGSGKTRSALASDDAAQIYWKPISKWWDGYQGQRTVLIDDLDPSHKFIAYWLKIWMDRYAISGEIKGGTIPLMHTRLIVTSQYHLSDIFEDQPTRDALGRRCRQICIAFPGVTRLYND